MVLKHLAWAVLALAVLPGLAAAQVSSMKPGPTRAVTSGTANTATAKDYLGTIVWRSPATGAKIQTLPTCNVYNNGAWIKVVDGQGTAATDNITITATGSSVSGPALPVVINVNRGGYVLTCDGAAASWLVTETALALGTGGGGGGGGTSFVLRNGGGRAARNGGGNVQRN
jgi:hypothetical protein